MEKKKEVTEVRVRIDTRDTKPFNERIKKIQAVTDAIKKLEEKGEYRCTLLEVEI